MKRAWLLAASALLVALSACGGSEPEPQVAPEVVTEDPVAIAVQQTLAAISVAETVAAVRGDSPTVEAPPDTPLPTAAPIEPTSTPAPAPADTGAPPPPTTAPAAAEAASCTVVTGVNLRSGPGTAYDPPVGSVGAGTALAPLAFSPVGFPQGQWLQVQVVGTQQTAWVSAGPQFVSCSVAFGDLPPAANVPPTPRPRATSTPTSAPLPTATVTRIVAGPPNVENDAPGGSFPQDGTVYGEVIVNPTFLFRMDVRDLANVGNFEGAGIKSVEFSITGNGVDYYRKEQTAGFCVFGGGEPTCHPWPTNAAGQYTWGVGGPVVETGNYFASISVTADTPDDEFGGSWNWNFPFRVTVPKP